MKKLLLILLLSFPLLATTTFVSATAQDDAGVDGTVLTKTGYVVTSGNLVYVFTHIQNQCNTITFTVTDSASNTYTKQVTEFQDTGNFTCETFFVAQNVTGGTLTITMTTSISTHLRSFSVAQFAGAPTTSAVEAVATGVASSTTALTVPTTGTFTVASTADIVVVGLGNYSISAVWTAGSGYTLAASGQSPNGVTHVMYNLTPSSGAQTATASVGSSNTALCGGVAVIKGLVPAIAGAVLR